MILIVLFIVGLCVGSFLNVVVDRIPNNESILYGRSYCDKCKKKLGWLELIPIVSFFLLKRKCKSCKAKISWQYPIVELATGIMFVVTYLFLIFNQIQNLSLFNTYYILHTTYYLLLASSLIAIFVTDLKYGIIPDKVLVFMLAVIIPYSILLNKNFLLSSFIAAFGAFLFFLLLFLFTKSKGMGLGDVKLAFIMGFLLNSPKIIVALYIAFLTGAIVSIILVLWGKKKFGKSTVPFAPFMVFGTFAAMFLGDQIWKIMAAILNL
jgi:prepilin signal peptidase PulO-like enzyme (type II secretory pathway)